LSNPWVAPADSQIRGHYSATVSVRKMKSVLQVAIFV
jgi:hypothetical protein